MINTSNHNYRWFCSVVDDEIDSSYHNFLEMRYHSGDNKYVVFRVSYGHQLGECTMLNKKQLTEIRNRINVMLEQMEDSE